MSDSQSNQTAPAPNPACERKKLIIEVMGTAHPDPHEFRLFDSTDQQQQEWLEGQVNKESLDEQVLHLWPWENHEPMNVWLDIASTEGGPIRVPLFNAAKETPRQPDEQWNRIWPFVPLTLLDDPNPEPGLPSQHTVPVRPGYIYVFRDGLLWRELMVSNAESGHLALSDVRLLDYRSTPGERLTEDRRPPVGKELASIWLPVRGMQRSLNGQFEVAYSEVQWSASRVAYLEANTAARAERCATPGNPKSPTKEPDSGGQWADLAGLPAMRLREAYLEQHLPRPWKSIRDLSGSYANNLFNQAIEEQQAYAADRSSAAQAHEAAGYRDAPLRGAPSVRAVALECVQSGEYHDTDHQTLWQALGSATDALANVRKNGWGVLVLEDRLFPVRQRLTQALDAQQYLTTLTERVAQEPHTDSAQLVYRVMGPDYIKGKENPLHEYIDEIDSSLFSKLHRTLHTAQRTLAVEEITLGQQRFVEVIEDQKNQRILADLFSLTGADYIEGFALAQMLVEALAVDPKTVDKLRINDANVGTAYTERAQSLLLDILADGSIQPLHAMLFPAGKGDALAEGNESEESIGDGKARPSDLKTLAEENPDPENLQTLSAVAIAGIARHESMDLSSLTKRLIAAVDAVFDGFNKSAQGAIAKLKSKAQQIDTRLYAPLLRQAKARAPELLGELRLVPRSGVPANWVVLGITDPEEGRSWGLTDAEREKYPQSAAGKKRFYGEFYRPGSTTPLATTNRTKMPDLGDTAEARNVHVYAAPASSKVTDAHRRMRQFTRWDEIAENVRLPYFIAVVEVFNISSESRLFERVYANRGMTRAYGGIASGGVDLVVASALATERLLLDVAKWEKMTKFLSATRFQISDDLIARFSVRLADALPKAVSYRLLGGLISGGLTVTVSLLDMFHELDTGDSNAAMGHATAAVGGGMMIMGGLMFSAASQSGAAVVLLGLGPGAWVAIGIALAVGGVIAALMLDDPPIVDWLKRGPFGDESDDQYPHLIDDPSATFYRLVGLLTQPRITLEPVRDLPVRLAEDGIKVDVRDERDWTRINHKVIIENNLSAFLDDSNLTGHLRLVSETTSISSKPSSNGFPTTRQTLNESSLEVLLEQPLANGIAYYLALPSSETNRGLFRQTIKGHSVAVRAQWQARFNGERFFHFPVPELDNPLSYSSTHSRPDFNKTDQPFWADEQTHKAE